MSREIVNFSIQHIPVWECLFKFTSRCVSEQFPCGKASFAIRRDCLLHNRVLAIDLWYTSRASSSLHISGQSIIPVWVYQLPVRVCVVRIDLLASLLICFGFTTVCKDGDCGTRSSNSAGKIRKGSRAVQRRVLMGDLVREVRHLHSTSWHYGREDQKAAAILRTGTDL